MNNKSTITILILSTLVMLAGCNKPPAQDQEVEMNDEVVLTATFIDLLKRGENFKCTFTDIVEEGMQSEGTVYVENDTNMRAEFSVEHENGKVENIGVIRAGIQNYVWMVEQNMGFVMEVNEDDTSLFGDMGENGDMGIQDSKPVDFECVKWKVDSTMFDPPKDIEFKDLKAYMESMMGGIDFDAMMGEIDPTGAADGVNMDAMKSQCGACDQIPDANAKEQCKKALGC